MTITITLGIWHFVIFAVIAFAVFTFIAWREDWHCYYWIFKPIVWACMPFVAIWCFFRNAIIACPKERFESVIKKPTSKRIKLFPRLWLCVDGNPLWWGQKIFLVRVGADNKKSR
jgi:hypothetical protein